MRSQLRDESTMAEAMSKIRLLSILAARHEPAGASAVSSRDMGANSLSKD